MIERIFQRDPSVWTCNQSEFEEITNRLGWLDSYPLEEYALDRIEEFAYQIRTEGFTHALLLGMGGSSLASEVLGRTYSHFNKNSEGLHFEILDSTDPEMVSEVAARNPVEKTLFIVSSKSGSTSEVMAMFQFFIEKARDVLGEDTGKHFIAITDPGTKLHRLAIENKFREIFEGDPSIGGRFSALSVFGLVPAALIGYSLPELLTSAQEMAELCRSSTEPQLNPGFMLGKVLANAWEQGKDKLTIVSDDGFKSFGSWLEQLIAESTGKDGKGVVPIDLEPLAGNENYSNDRLFVYLRSVGNHDGFIGSLKSKFPVFVMDLKTPYDLGAEFFRWEFATAVLCAFMNVNAFNQPDVQDNKTRTEEKLRNFGHIGTLATPNGRMIGNVRVDTLETFFGMDSVNEIVKTLLSSSQPNDYIAINAYVNRNEVYEATLERLREKVLKGYRKATTLGFGPRFLHSTGQLHKGGPNTGVFMQINVEPTDDLQIPEESYTFGILELAQSVGDFEALVDRGRRIVRLTFPSQESFANWVDSF